MKQETKYIIKVLLVLSSITICLSSPDVFKVEDRFPMFLIMLIPSLTLLYYGLNFNFETKK